MGRGRRAGADPGSTTRCPRCGPTRASTYRSLARARALALSRLGRVRRGGRAARRTVASEHPRDEEVLAGAAALRGGHGGRRRRRWPGTRPTAAALRDELGTDPGPALQARAPASCCRASAPVVRHGVPHEPNPLLGRDDDIAAVAEPAAYVPGHLDRRARRPGQDPARARGEPRGGAARWCTSSRSPASPPTATSSARSPRPSASARLGAARDGHPASPADVLAGIVAALGPGPALLVLDNCEHVLRGAAELVRALVSLTRDLRVLTTSRAPLGPVLGVGVSAARAGPADRRSSCSASGPGRRGPGAELPAEAVGELCAPSGRAAARGGAGRGAGPGDVGGRDRPPAGRPVRAAAGRRPGRPASGTRRCTRSSTGAGTCSTRPGRRRCARCRSFPAGSPPTPRAGLLGDGDAMRCWSSWSTSRC